MNKYDLIHGKDGRSKKKIYQQKEKKWRVRERVITFFCHYQNMK